ncbi:hypothetical protein [Pseudonocardia alaniniphila]|uniref:Secreted protein n=1 Tax=Pseudonocardia alaniniphila TaxID=75291 RepID=A0ABS9TUX0_9PSEU|nr:hypothetical protein [Pseudonocardia alaniniphila]MCH6172355.1 hypothetical protein [Pseudonocardia alaniniphila]
MLWRLLVDGLLVVHGFTLGGLVLDGLLPATAAPGRCFPQAECQLPECLEHPQRQLTQELQEQRDLADDKSESERRPDPTQQRLRG